MNLTLDPTALDQARNCQVLFGKKGNKKLGYDSFLLFLRSLQDDVLRLEFESFSPDRRDTIRSSS